MDKPALRAQMHTLRANLSKSYQQSANQALVNTILQAECWQQSDAVAIYLAFKQEADITELLTANKDIYLPSIKNQTMQFQLYTKEMQFEKLNYGLKQPHFIDGLPNPDMDLYLMPLLAFDLKGNRLGMGGGYYDRYFANIQTGIRAGVAYNCQQVDQLPTEQWDVRLHTIFTEQGQLNL
jgi:5-formyltetrahydrofolate cyclo-ligase